MLKVIKYNIEPILEQRQKLSHAFGCVRFVYNWGLTLKTESYSNGTKLNCFDTINKLTEFKKENIWLQETNAQILQMSLRNLDNAYTKFFHKQSRFPRYKSKKGKQSIQYPQRVKIDLKLNQIYLPKIGWVKANIHRFYEGKIKTVTISKDKLGKYYAAVLFETITEPIQPVKIINENQVVGVDLGIKSFAVLSNGLEIKNPRLLKNSESRLKVKQRQFSRKKKGSNKRKVAKKELNKIHSKITNQRNDFQHKISRFIVNNFDLICLEDLDISKMLKNSQLAKSISDVSWNSFRIKIEYKAKEEGKTVEIINRFQATSQPCLNCHKLNPLIKNLKIRKWTCPNCNYLNLRDLTASKNIKTFGMIQLGLTELGSSINKAPLSSQPLVVEFIPHIKLELRNDSKSL